MNVEDILDSIRNNDSISFSDSFLFAKKCAELLRNKKNSHLGRSVLIHILNNWNKVNQNTQEMWIELLEAEGFYPYIAKENLQLKYTNSQLRKEMSQSNNIRHYFHDEQLYVKNLIDSGKNVIVSAPTSFGKSLLIEELVAKKNIKI